LEDYYLIGKALAADNATTRALLESRDLLERHRTGLPPREAARPAQEDVA
jgi:hypothetical protein